MKLKEAIAFVQMNKEDREEFIAMNKNREKKGLVPWGRERFLKWKSTYYKEKYKRGE